MRRKSDDIVLGVVFTVVIGGIFLGVQDAQEGARADRAEMLADLTYVRETIRDGGPKVFQNLNLRGANLSGLDLGCDPRLMNRPHWHHQIPDENCVVFTGTDFTDAVLDNADLSGAFLDNVIFRPVPSRGVSMAGTYVSGDIAADFEESDLRGVRLTWVGLRNEPLSSRPGYLTARQGVATGADLILGDVARVRFERVDVSGAWVNTDDDSQISWGQGCLAHPIDDQCRSPLWGWLTEHMSVNDSKDFADYVAGTRPTSGCGDESEPCDVEAPTGRDYEFPSPDEAEMRRLTGQLVQLYPSLAVWDLDGLREEVRQVCENALADEVDGGVEWALDRLVEPASDVGQVESKTERDLRDARDRLTATRIADLISGERWCRFR